MKALKNFCLGPRKNIWGWTGWRVKDCCKCTRIVSRRGREERRLLAASRKNWGWASKTPLSIPGCKTNPRNKITIVSSSAVARLAVNPNPITFLFSKQFTMTYSIIHCRSALTKKSIWTIAQISPKVPFFLTRLLTQIIECDALSSAKCWRSSPVIFLDVCFCCYFDGLFIILR